MIYRGIMIDCYVVGTGEGVVVEVGEKNAFFDVL